MVENPHHSYLSENDNNETTATAERWYTLHRAHGGNANGGRPIFVVLLEYSVEFVENTKSLHQKTKAPQHEIYIPLITEYEVISNPCDSGMGAQTHPEIEHGDLYIIRKQCWIEMKDPLSRPHSERTPSIMNQITSLADSSVRARNKNLIK